MTSQGQADAVAVEVGALPTVMAGATAPAVAAAGSTPTGTDEALPSDLLDESVRRLSISMWAVAAVYVVYALLFSTVWQRYAQVEGYVIGLASLTASVSLPFLLRSCRESQRRVFLIGLVYEAAICFGIELEHFFRTAEASEFSVRVSWTCMIIVFFPVLSPAPLRRIALASGLAALTTPLAFAIAFAIRGRPMPELAPLISQLVPPFLAAGLSLVPAHVIGRITAQVSRARRLGSYRLIERLGAGGMGEVWRAEHELLIRPAAIKLIRPDLGGSPDARRRLLERFEREAQATASLESPHTVELYDFGVADDGVLYYVMELLHGVDLDSLVRRHGPLPADRVAHILEQVCDSLEDAHRSGLIHRDVKPANLYLAHRAGRYDYVKVLDFGLVKLAQPELAPDLNVSQAGEVSGTPAFMPPEIACGEPADGRSDLYSLGCVAYWLLSGRLVFDETSAIKMIVAHSAQAPVALADRGVAVPAALDQLIMACLAKDPADRPASAAELGARLRATGLAASWTRERAQAWWQERRPELEAQVSARRSLNKPGALLAPARLRRSSAGTTLR